jgi:hypothetical protein
MGAAASAGSLGALEDGDVVERLQCHQCGCMWARKAASDDLPPSGGRWTCECCTLNNEGKDDQCAACEAPRTRHHHDQAEQRVCPSCGGEFVERIQVGVHRAPLPPRIHTSISPATATGGDDVDISVQELLFHMAQLASSEEQSSHNSGGCQITEAGEVGAGGDGGSRLQSPDPQALSLALALQLSRQLEAVGERQSAGASESERES